MLAPNETDAPGVNGAEILSFVERAERLHEERKAIAADISDIFAEAKSRGYDVKAIKALIKERAEDPDVAAEHETIVDLYRRALAHARM